MVETPNDWTPPNQIDPVRLNDNLALIYEHHPHLVPLLKAHMERTELEVREAAPGEYQCRVRQPDGSVLWVAGQDSLDAEVRQFGEVADEVFQKGSDLLLCIGAGLGYLPMRVARAIWETERFLLVVERDPALLLAVLSLHDLSDVLKMPNVQWLIGEEQIQRFPDAIQKWGLFRHGRLGFFRGGFPRTPVEQNADEALVRGFSQSLQDQYTAHAACVEKLETTYTKSAVRELQKILVVDMWEGTPGQRHLQCMMEALAEKGFALEYLNLPRRGWAMEIPGHARRVSGPFAAYLERTRPDAVLTIQSDRSRMLSEELLDRIQVPWVTYITAYMDWEPQIGEREYLVSAEDDLTRRKHQQGYRRLCSIPLAADHLNEPLPPPVWEHGDFELTFFGRSFAPGPEKERDYESQFKPYSGLFDRVNDLGRELAGFDSSFSIFEVPSILTAEWNLPQRVLRAAQRFAFEIGTSIDRVAMVRALLDRGIQVFGFGWEKVLNQDELERCWRGPAPITQEENLYRHSGINLNMHACGNRYCPNMRFFNAPAVGGFQISDNPHKFEVYLEPDTEVVLYRNTEELQAAVDRYLSDAEARHAIADAGRARVLADHTYRNRIERFLPVFEAAARGDDIEYKPE